MKKSGEWAALAEAAGADNEVELRLIRFVVNENEVLKRRDANDAVRTQLQARINRLQGFTKLAGELISQLKRRVQELPEAD